MRVGLLIVVMILLLSGCDKYRASRWEGAYLCTVHLTAWNMTGYSIDSSYVDTVEIYAQNRSIVIFGNEVPVDSLRNEQLYSEGYGHDYFQVQFKGDSIYYLISSGGLGGNGSYEYRGIKNK